jgi:GINS complex subunit 3
MAPEYFDPHDIVCGEQRIRVRFTRNVPWSPTLTSEQPISGQVDKGSIMDLPIWLAEVLSQNHIVDILPSRPFGSRVTSDLEAGPEALNLRDLAQYYYRLGEKCSHLMPNEGIASLMKKAFISRIEFIGRPLTMPSLSRHVSALSETADPHRAIFHGSGQTLLAKLDHEEEQCTFVSFS